MFDFEVKGIGTSTPLGEAQSKELQPLGTLDVFCKHFAFSGLSIYKGVGVGFQNGRYWRKTYRRSSSDGLMRLIKKSVNETGQEKC